MSAPRLTSSSVDRRRFLEYVWWGAGSAMAMALLPGGTLKAARRFASNPFTLGVASGDPTASGIVLWTRLAPEPADPTALGRAKIPVGWRVARDDAMRRVVAQGKASATPELAHSVHVEVEGLRPGADYFYQFDSRRRGERGRPLPHRARRTTTGRASSRSPSPPARTSRAATTRAYRDMVQNDLDLVLHLGDYTYEYGFDGLEPGRTRGRAVQRGAFGPAHVPAAPHAAQARPRPAGGPRRRSRSSWCGTTTRCRTTTRGWRPSGDRRRRSSPPAGPPRTRRSTSTCRSACRVRSIRRTSCGSTAA